MPMGRNDSEMSGWWQSHQMAGVEGFRNRMKRRVGCMCVGPRAVCECEGSLSRKNPRYEGDWEWEEWLKLTEPAGEPKLWQWLDEWRPECNEVTEETEWNEAAMRTGRTAVRKKAAKAEGMTDYKPLAGRCWKEWSVWTGLAWPMQGNRWRTPFYLFSRINFDLFDRSASLKSPICMA